MAQPEQKRSNSLLFWVAGIAVLIAVVVAIRSLTRERVRVKVAPVTYQTLSSTVPPTARSKPSSPFQAHAPGPGVVRHIYVNEGDHVQAGQLLIELSDADARSRLATAQAQLSQARLQLADLGKGGSTEEPRPVHQHAQLRQARTRVRRGEPRDRRSPPSEGIGISQRGRQRTIAAAVRGGRPGQRGQPPPPHAIAPAIAATRRPGWPTPRPRCGPRRPPCSRSTFTLPISGDAYFIPVSEFDFVHDGDDLMDVADLHRLQVRAYFDEPEVGKLSVGQPVRIDWAAKPARAGTAMSNACRRPSSPTRRPAVSASASSPSMTPTESFRRTPTSP